MGSIPWCGDENLGKSLGNSHNLWKLWRKSPLTSSYFIFSICHILLYYPFMGILIRSVVMVTLGHGYQMHWSRNSSHWIHLCCSGEMPTFVSASWWKQKVPEIRWYRKWQRVQEYSVLGKMHAHFLKNLINKHYVAYYNDLNAISDRLLYLPITTWKKIYQKKWVEQWKITPTNSGSYLLNLVNRPFSSGRNAIEIH